MTEVRITGTYKQCPECRAPMIVQNGRVQQRVQVSGNPDAPLLTPHRDDCEVGLDPIPPYATMTLHFTGINTDLMRLLTGQPPVDREE